jgi:hypothetical protein
VGSVGYAAVQDRFAAVNLDRPGMVRGMPVHDINAGVDQPVRELAGGG